MGKRSRRKSLEGSSRKDRYVYRPPVPWFARLLDQATAPYFLGGLTGALVGLLIALFAVETQVVGLGGDLHSFQVRFRPSGMVLYQQQGPLPALQTLANRAFLVLGLVPIALGLLGGMIGRIFTRPRVEEVFEQPR